ncbi:hypothetical protein BaRGS_00023337 [Batillaria attramentaria]|uniref:Uncharacterized protein n=1 Tax=Batillaria attramentaria TaxID=370345 RepID=A0ABD0KE06_9CAEN
MALRLPLLYYTLGGHEVLLVADELNDAIHVVNVQDRSLTFGRYLAPGCPLLVQPTALSSDARGRLWVACRGGRILTCTPISSSALSTVPQSEDRGPGTGLEPVNLGVQVTVERERSPT